MHKRLASAKPTYPYLKFEKEFEKAKYHEKLISNKIINPNMEFLTPETVLKNTEKGLFDLKNRLGSAKLPFKTTQSSFNNSIRPQTVNYMSSNNFS